MNNNQISLYQTKDGHVSIDVQMEEETVWLSQKQMAELFNKDVKTVNEHIKNIFKEGELTENSVIRKFRITASDGKKYNTNFYNLDVIISVGYRVKSREGTQFRIWATKTLRDHLVQGYTINQKRLQEKGLDEFEKAIALIKDTIERKELTTDEAKGLLNVITNYADSWILLQKYDQNELAEPTDKTPPTHVINYTETEKAIAELKKNLKKQKEASDLFGLDKEKILQGILGNLYQTFDGDELYTSIEEKAAHLLYFVIKDHPFVDGNKRIGAFLFILFLEQNNYLYDAAGEKKFNDNALVAIALLVAESDPKQKESIIKLVMNFVANS